MDIIAVSRSRDLLSENLRRRRKELGLTQAQLADAMGCSRVFVTQLERGGRWPSDETLDSLAHALEMPLASMFLAAEPVSRQSA
ncbi:MAG: helix-turn-helix transcriptional regulator [Actinomycetota bacterium]